MKTLEPFLFCIAFMNKAFVFLHSVTLKVRTTPVLIENMLRTLR
jgi:hypothetical protein